MSKTHLAGAMILAGGESRRMGSDKAALLWKGLPLIEQVIKELQPFEVPLLVVNRNENARDYFGARSVCDLFPGAGPVGGILTGLKSSDEGWHIVVACDMPYLKREVFELLLTEAGDDFDAVVPVHDGGVEPLCALYNASAISGLQAFLDSGRRAAHLALKTLQVKEIGEDRLRLIDPDLSCFTNWNHPEDLFAGRETPSSAKF